MIRLMTLCFILRDKEVLLGFKKRGFGAGRWNGFGGKVHEDESIEDAARRELLEEAGITVKNLAPRGVLIFNFENDPVALEVHVFSASSWRGEPTESDEMSPQWTRTDAIPYDKMWPDDRFWLPLLLEGKNITGTFLFKDIDTMLTHEVRELV